MRNVLSSVGLAAALVAGCANAEAPVGANRAAVGNGDPSTETRAVMVMHGGSSFCPGAIVGPRHVLVASYCAMDPLRVVVGTSLRSPDSVHDSVELRRGADSSVTDAGGERIGPVIAIVDPPFDQEPLAIAEAAPAVDDELTLVGHGAAMGSGTLTEGPIRVTEVGSDNFTSEAVGDIRHCLDGAILDSSGALTGFSVTGSGGSEGCVEASTNLTLAEWHDWIAETVAATPAPDAGTGGGDAGTSSDAGSEPSSDGGGCAASGSGGRRGGLWVIGLLALLAFRRRR